MTLFPQQSLAHLFTPSASRSLVPAEKMTPLTGETPLFLVPVFSEYLRPRVRVLPPRAAALLISAAPCEPAGVGAGGAGGGKVASCEGDGGRVEF